MSGMYTVAALYHFTRFDDPAALRGLLLEHLAGLSDAERAAFADRLEEVLRRGPPRPPRG